jgi:hypothetical protein
MSKFCAKIRQKTEMRLELERARGEIAPVQARLDAFTLAYGMGRDRPLPLAAMIAVSAVAVAVLLIVVRVVL